MNGDLSACPDKVPDFLDAPGVAAEQLELLHGAFEPPVLRARRRRRWAAVLGGGLLSAALVCVGFERRIHAARDHATSLADRESEALVEVLGPAPPTVPLAQRRMALTSERRQLEKTRMEPVGASVTPNASQILAGVLELWPALDGVRVNHLAVTNDLVTVRGSANASADAQALADELGCLPEFTVEPPRFNAARGSVSFTVQLRREGASP